MWPISPLENRLLKKTRQGPLGDEIACRATGYDRYLDGALDALADHSPRPIAQDRRDDLIAFALEHEAPTTGSSP